MSARSLSAEDAAASGSHGPAQVFVFEGPQSLNCADAAERGQAPRSRPVAEPSAAATLEEAARALLNV